MGVDVEDELAAGGIAPLLGSVPVGSFHRGDVVHLSVHLVHRQERGRHAALRTQVTAAGNALAAGLQFGVALQQPLDPSLAARLRRRQALAARHHLRGHRRLHRLLEGALEPAELRAAQPHGHQAAPRAAAVMQSGQCPPRLPSGSG